jgi:hypothetical protein
VSLPGNDLLAQIENESPKLGQYIRNYLLPAIQTTAQNAAVSPTAKIAAPASPESVSVSTSGETMQVVVNHTSEVTKGVRYFTHISTNPQFTNAMVIDHGTSRAPAPISLPTKDAGGNTHNYYVATVAQYPGSDPSEPTFYGGAQPVAVTMGGTTQMDVMPGTGSGTASNGGQTFVGFGKAQVRLAPATENNTQ